MRSFARAALLACVAFGALGAGSAEAKQRVVGKYRVELAARLYNHGSIHSANALRSSSEPRTADGRASFAASVHWTAGLKLRAGKAGKRRPKPYMEVTNADAPGAGPAANLEMGAPGVNARTMAAWTGSYAFGDSTVDYSCGYDALGSALAPYVRVSYIPPPRYADAGRLDGRKAYLPVYLALTTSSLGDTSRLTLDSSCRSGDPRPEVQGARYHGGAGFQNSPLGAMFSSREEQRGVAFPLSRLLRRAGRSVTLRSRDRERDAAGLPFDGYTGTTEARVTATLRSVR